MTPDTTKWAHLVGSVVTEAEAHVYFYEGATLSNGAGTAVTAYNRNRNSATAATVTVTHTPSIAATGTLIFETHFGSGRGVGGQVRAVEEWVLDQNQTYLLRVTNATALNNYIAINLNWYEHTDAA